MPNPGETVKNMMDHTNNATEQTVHARMNIECAVNAMTNSSPHATFSEKLSTCNELSNSDKSFYKEAYKSLSKDLHAPK